MKSDTVPDIIGVAAVALASGAVVAGLSRMQVVSQPWAVWLLALPLLIGASVYAWYGSDRTSSWESRKWGQASIISLVCGAIFFAVDVLVGGSDAHYKTFFEAASHSGLLGLPLTILSARSAPLLLWEAGFGVWPSSRQSRRRNKRRDSNPWTRGARITVHPKISSAVVTRFK